MLLQDLVAKLEKLGLDYDEVRAVPEFDRHRGSQVEDRVDLFASDQDLETLKKSGLGNVFILLERARPLREKLALYDAGVLRHARISIFLSCSRQDTDGSS